MRSQLLSRTAGQSPTAEAAGQSPAADKEQPAAKEAFVASDVEDCQNAAEEVDDTTNT